MADKTCRCGYTKTHHFVSPEGRYSLTGWFLVTLVGISYLPKKIVYRCRKCGETLGETTDPAILKRHINS